MEDLIMNINAATGGDIVRMPSVDRTPPVQARKQSSSSGSDLAQITSIQAMKKAESSGTNIPVSEEQLIRAIDRAIQAMQGKSTSLEFAVHDQTKQIMVKVLDKDTGEIIREIPPEKTLDFVAKLWEMAGILVDERR
jgi:flagellar protein FlaG